MNEVQVEYLEEILHLGVLDTGIGHREVVTVPNLAAQGTFDNTLRYMVGISGPSVQGQELKLDDSCGSLPIQSIL